MDDGCPAQPDHSIMVLDIVALQILSFPVLSICWLASTDWPVKCIVALVPFNSLVASFILSRLQAFIGKRRKSGGDSSKLSER